MSRVYICAVSPQFPENYEIGVRTGTWGVSDGYARRIRGVVQGDMLVFIVGGRFRSVHTILSAPYHDPTLLWPPREGDVYPHRIRISPPEAAGDAPVRDLASRISFMKGRVWGGTIMGANGVFNDRATQPDLELIRAALQAHPIEGKPVVRPRDKLQPRAEIGLATLLDELAAMSRLRRASAITNPFTDDLPWGRGLVAGVFMDVKDVPTLAVAPIDRSPSDTVLSTLFGLSALKQADPQLKRVQGRIFVHSQEFAIQPFIIGVPNLEAVPYQLHLSLSP